MLEGGRGQDNIYVCDFSKVIQAMYPNIFLCEVSLNLFSGKILIPQARAFLFLATRIQGTRIHSEKCSNFKVLSYLYQQQFKKRDFSQKKNLDLSKDCLRRPLRS